MRESTLIVSLDFELFWGMQDGWELSEYEENILGGRAAIPKMLELFRRHGIHATWASVGFLFADGPEDLKAFFPDLLPAYADKTLDPYAYLETLAKEDYNCFFAPELLQKIAATPGQEIGSHTFCHYYCREKGQTVEEFEADMRAAKAIAERKKIEI